MERWDFRGWGMIQYFMGKYVWGNTRGFRLQLRNALRVQGLEAGFRVITKDRGIIYMHKKPCKKLKLIYELNTKLK